MIERVKVHAYLYSPLLIAIAYDFLSEFSIYLKVFLTFLTLIHCRWGLWFLVNCGLVEFMFDMEMLTGFDRAFLLGGTDIVES